MQAWAEPPPTPVLGSDDVHVWRASLRRTSELPRLRQTLSADEAARADRFRFAVDRDRFVAARGVLRAILTRYLGGDPAGLRFSSGPHGKPALADQPATGLRFNLSHAGELALYAVARGREVGIDLERVRADLDTVSIAREWFTPLEQAALADLPPDRRTEAFFACWTCKEACIKAVGRGLSLSPGQVEVRLGAGSVTVVVNADPTAPSRWTVRPLAPVPGYTAALAVPSQDDRLVCWQWPDPRERLGTPG